MLAVRRQVNKVLPLTILELNAIVVEVRVIILALHDVDTSNERFTAEVYIESKWDYNSVIEKDVDIEKLSDDWKPKWRPELKILNVISEAKSDLWYKIAEINEKKHIFEMKRVKGTFYEKLELQYYPIDVQRLNLSIISSHDTSKCQLVKCSSQPSTIIFENFRDSQEWYLYNYVGVDENERLESKYSLSEGEFSKITFYCAVARKYNYFFWNAFYLIFLISVSSFAAFSISYLTVNSRLQFNTTLLLTSVSFKWVINRSLPAIAYLTTQDIYSVFTISFLALLSVFHSIINHFSVDNTLDTTVLIVSASFFTITHILFILWLIIWPFGIRRYYSKLESDYQKELQNNRSIRKNAIVKFLQ